jgi:hypothetical protein
VLITLFAYIIECQTREFTVRKHQYSPSDCVKSDFPIVPKLNYVVQYYIPFLVMYSKLGHKRGEGIIPFAFPRFPCYHLPSFPSNKNTIRTSVRSVGRVLNIVEFISWQSCLILLQISAAKFLPPTSAESAAKKHTRTNFAGSGYYTDD